ncbi:MAG: PAS domain S-box protein [Deltaproteobacteria bacterium]|nr:PAS domain S-box protein [Deltaproteobacteria bacterium]
MSIRFVEALQSGEDWLLARLLQYASEADYTRYATIKEEEWRLVVAGPVRALASWLKTRPDAEPIHVEEHPALSEAASFGVLEAKRHRARGITLEMFLGMTKLLRNAVLDLSWQLDLPQEQRRPLLDRVLRFFDKFELGVTAEWVSLSVPERMTELEAANRRMTNERARYWTVFQSMAEPAYVVDNDMNLIAVNTALEKFYGQPSSEILNRPCRDVLNHSLCDTCPLREAMRDRRTFSGVEQQIPVRGKNRTVLMSGSFLDDISGKYAGGVVLLQDITERKSAEIALRDGERKYRTIFETVAMLILTIDQSGTVLDCNPRIEGTLGYKREEVVGRSLGALLPPDVRDRAAAHLRDLVGGGILRDQDYRMVKKDGSPIEVRVDSSSICDEDGRFDRAIILIDDITAERKLEARLVQAQKMEAVGRLAGGVAHDFNNLLTVIIGSSTFLDRKMPQGDPMRVELEQISRAAERGASLTRQLLAFSRRQVLRSQVLSVNSIITDLDGMMRRIIGEDIVLDAELEPELGCVRADSTQIEQVIMNLAVNARDAMVHGGRLVIRTSRALIDEGEAAVRPGLKPGPHVLLQVIDTGAGMDEETKLQVFEPFFTTKPRGTGLGLSTAYGIVRQSGGHIACESHPGGGTTFSVWLPLVDEARSQPEPAAGVRGESRGSEIVLLVEDEPSVRELASETLRASGYTVLEASDGDEALRIASGQAGSIDLLVTDVVMPHMSGRELAQRLLQQRAGVRVLFISGYASESGGPGSLPAGAELLLKPFTPQELSSRARSVLDAAPSSPSG